MLFTYNLSILWYIYVQYHLYVLDKVRRGLEDARVNGTLSQEEVESRFSKWLTE